MCDADGIRVLRMAMLMQTAYGHDGNQGSDSDRDLDPDPGRDQYP